MSYQPQNVVFTAILWECCNQPSWSRARTVTFNGAAKTAHKIVYFWSCWYIIDGIYGTNESRIMTESREIKEQAQKEEILSSIDVAKYFLILVDREAGDVITQLKLQKLMYLVQGIHVWTYPAMQEKNNI